MKKLMSLMLVALLVCSLFSMGVSAENVSSVSDEAAYAKYFPEGVPDYLNDEQIQQVLNGQYLSVVVNGEIITYNPENNPAYAIGQTRAGQTVWDEDLTKDHTWWPEYGYLTYTITSDLYKSSTKYYIGNQDQQTSSPRGRSWCYILLTNDAVANMKNEEVVSPLIGSKYVYVNCAIARSSPVDYLQYAYRNLRTDWNKSIKVK